MNALQVRPRPLYVETAYGWSGPPMHHDEMLRHHAREVDKAVVRALSWGVFYGVIEVVRMRQENYAGDYGGVSLRSCVRVAG